MFNLHPGPVEEDARLLLLWQGSAGTSRRGGAQVSETKPSLEAT
jgi:hypothetical protein